MDYFLIALVPVIAVGVLAARHFLRMLNESQAASQKKMAAKRSRFSEVRVADVDVRSKSKAAGFGRRG